MTKTQARTNPLSQKPPYRDSWQQDNQGPLHPPPPVARAWGSQQARRPQQRPRAEAQVTCKFCHVQASALRRGAVTRACGAPKDVSGFCLLAPESSRSDVTARVWSAGQVRSASACPGPQGTVRVAVNVRGNGGDMRPSRGLPVHSSDATVLTCERSVRPSAFLSLGLSFRLGLCNRRGLYLSFVTCPCRLSLAALSLLSVSVCKLLEDPGSLEAPRPIPRQQHFKWLDA